MSTTAVPPLRIGLVSAAYRPYPSGVSEHVFHLGCELQRLGQHVHVLTTNFAEPAEETEPFPVTRFGRAILVPLNRSYATLPIGIGIPFQVPGCIHRQRFDVIHCHGIFPPEIAYWALVGTRTPAVVTFHTIGSLPPEPALRLFRSLFSGLNRRLSARIGVSRAGAEFARQLFPGNYYVIPNGVDLDRFCTDAPVPPVMKAAGPTVLYVGRFDQRKGLPVLIRAMRDVIAAVPSARLVAVGTGLLEAECRRLARELGIAPQVVFAGRASNEALPGYYAGCAVYVSPALGGEAMGIVLVEALGCGKPVVASDITGYNEVLHDGTDGLLVPPGQPQPLARAIVSVLANDDLRARLSGQAARRARDFSWPSIARQVLGLYQDVIKPSRLSAAASTEN